MVQARSPEVMRQLMRGHGRVTKGDQGGSGSACDDAFGEFIVQRAAPEGAQRFGRIAGIGQFARLWKQRRKQGFTGRAPLQPEHQRVLAGVALELAATAFENGSAKVSHGSGGIVLLRAE